MFVKQPHPSQRGQNDARNDVCPKRVPKGVANEAKHGSNFCSIVAADWGLQWAQDWAEMSPRCAQDRLYWPHR